VKPSDNPQPQARQTQDEVIIDLPPLPTPEQVVAASNLSDTEPEPRPGPDVRRHSQHHNGRHRNARTYVPPAEEDMIRDIDTLKLCGGMRRYYVMKTPMVRIIRGSLGLTNMDRERMKQDTAEDTHKVIGALAHLNIPRPPFLVEVSALCFHFHARFCFPVMLISLHRGVVSASVLDKPAILDASGCGCSRHRWRVCEVVADDYVPHVDFWRARSCFCRDCVVIAAGHTRHRPVC
jgi:hypothetical protein